MKVKHIAEFDVRIGPERFLIVRAERGEGTTIAQVRPIDILSCPSTELMTSLTVPQARALAKELIAAADWQEE